MIEAGSGTRQIAYCENGFLLVVVRLAIHGAEQRESMGEVRHLRAGWR